MQWSRVDFGFQWTVGHIAKECLVDVGKFSSEGFSGDLGQRFDISDPIPW